MCLCIEALALQSKYPAEKLRSQEAKYQSEISSEGVLPMSEKLCPPTDHPPIPKIFHHIWFDFGKGKEPNAEYQNLTDRLLRMHPGWKHILWHEAKVIKLIEEQVPFFLYTFQSYDMNIKRHDSARLVILYAMGGVYLDHDFIPIKSIEPALGTCKFFVSTEENKKNVFTAWNGIIGSVAKNPFLLFALKMMDLPEVRGQHVFFATGPRLIDRALNAYMKAERPDGFKIYHPKFFNPFTWAEGSGRIKNYTLAEIQSRVPDSIFIQFYQGSWPYA